MMIFLEVFYDWFIISIGIIEVAISLGPNMIASMEYCKCGM